MNREGRSSLLLSELTVAVLFFALSAAVALSVFLVSHQRSVRSGEILAALGRAQDALETVTARAAAGELPEVALEAMGFVRGADGVFVEGAEADADGARLRAVVTREDAAAGTLWRVRVAFGDAGWRDDERGAENAGNSANGAKPTDDGFCLNGAVYMPTAKGGDPT